MKILLTNDDGIQATGINTLAEEFEARGHDVYVVAPSSERSAASHSITIHTPLRVTSPRERRWAVDGTPVDCIFLGLEALVGKDIDLVISGINSGQNMGEDILYSGTVAAALEAMFLDCPALAVSIKDYKDQCFSTAAVMTADMVEAGIGKFVNKSRILNLNFPNLPLDQIRGIKITRVGHRRYRNYVREELQCGEERVFLVGGDIADWSKEDCTDFHEVVEGFVSITPLYPHFDVLEPVPQLSEWLRHFRSSRLGSES